MTDDPLSAHILDFRLGVYKKYIRTNIMIAGTLQTDPRSGGVKRSSGVNVLPSVAEGACLPLFL